MAIDPAGAFVRHFGHRLWLRYKGESGIYRYRRRFARFWNADRARLDAVRIQSLKRLLLHAYQTSEFYRERFDSCRFDPNSLSSFTDLGCLTILTKRDLNERMDAILSNAFDRGSLMKASTGGSSGVPLTFYRDRRATMVRRSQDLLFNQLIGIRPGVRRAWVWGSELDAFSMRSLKARIMNFLTERAIYFYSYDATQESMQAFFAALKKHRPRVIFAYPNMLTALAETARAQGEELPKTVAVVTTAEPLYEFQRELFRDVFGAETYERYGSREFGTAAAQVRPGQGLFLFEPGYHFEVITPGGDQAKAGQFGELVITDFWNYAMPLIRYQTGDMVRIEAEPSPISSWRRLAEIGGRVVDLLVRPDGSRIAGQAMIMILRTTGVRSRVQVVQVSPSSLLIKHLRGEEPDANFKERLGKRIEELFRAPMNVSYQAFEALGYDKSGKYRYVTSECN